MYVRWMGQLSVRADLFFQGCLVDKRWKDPRGREAGELASETIPYVWSRCLFVEHVTVLPSHLVPCARVSRIWFSPVLFNLCTTFVTVGSILEILAPFGIFSPSFKVAEEHLLVFIVSSCGEVEPCVLLNFVQCLVPLGKGFQFPFKAMYVRVQMRFTACPHSSLCNVVGSGLSKREPIESAHSSSLSAHTLHPHYERQP